MEATTEEFLRDVNAATQTSTALPSKNAAVEAALHKYREVAKLKLALPLTQLDAAREEIEKFIQFRLEELQSQQETKNLVGELSSRITDHQSRVRRLLRSEPLRHPEVVPLVLVGMAANRPLKSNFFPGLLEGLLGRLGKAIRYQRSSRTRFSSPTWLTWCTRYLSLQWCQRCFPLLVAVRFRPSQVSQRMMDPNQRCRNRRSPPQVPQSPANRSRSESPRPPTLTRIRPP